MSWYEINPNHTITDMSVNWCTDCIQSEDAPCHRACILGSNLMAYIDGMETKGYLNALFFYCNLSGSAVQVHYRCDGPDIRRGFEMNIERRASGVVRASHDLLWTDKGNSIVSLASEDQICRCSQCLRHKLGKEWHEGYFAANIPDDSLRYVICPDCREAANGALMGGVIPFSAANSGRIN